MHCIDNQPGAAPAALSTRLHLLSVLLAALLAGCASKAPAPAAPAAPPAPAAAPAARPGAPAAPAARTPAPEPGQSPTPATSPVATAPTAPSTQRVVKLPPPTTSRNMTEVRLQAARRLVAAHPDGSYMSKPVQPLLGVPVLKITLNADGSVNSVLVLREPQEAKETIRQAIDAVYRAAPYGDVSRLPRPWEFIETFLFEHNGRFKPMTLDR